MESYLFRAARNRLAIYSVLDLLDLGKLSAQLASICARKSQKWSDNPGQWPLSLAFLSFTISAALCSSKMLYHYNSFSLWDHKSSQFQPQSVKWAVVVIALAGVCLIGQWWRKRMKKKKRRRNWKNKNKSF